MRILRIDIENFRGLRKLVMATDAPVVVIAGANGSGKSCILDAIRLVKSCYGGYAKNEINSWFNELNINLNKYNKENANHLFYNKYIPVKIEVEFELSENEQKYLIENGRKHVESQLWKFKFPDEMTGTTASRETAPLATQHRLAMDEIQSTLDDIWPIAEAELKSSKFVGRIELSDDIFVADCSIAEMVFSIYDAPKIGILDYHGPSRLYGRESFSNVNISLDDPSDKNLAAHSLYNYTNKYSNIKSDIAGAYVKAMIAEKAGSDKKYSEDLTTTLKELFARFFPNKIFLGPTPTEMGYLEFPVEITGGGQHDLNELSVGEKEILFGYLRMRRSAPGNSIIMIDEPELHLNPRLIRELPEFYRKNLAENLSNQIFLVTHSDCLLREAVMHGQYIAYHISPVDRHVAVENQAARISSHSELDQAIIGLVGDLAYFRPRAVFERAESAGIPKSASF